MKDYSQKKDSKFGMLIAAFILLSGIVLSLFRHWEPSGEGQLYWLFARIFSETGDFVIMGRSPLYVLYLNIFRWLGYPQAIIAEYVVTSFIVTGSLVILLRKYIGLSWAVFAVLLWIPFFQIGEPPVQKLGLACMCLAVAVRDQKLNRFRIASSYALAAMAYMFRTAYLVFFLVLVAADAFRITKAESLKRFFAKLCPRKSDWPVFSVLIILFWFNFAQSPHHWNNGNGATTTWFPSDGKSIANGAFIQGYNWHYIFYKYGTFENKDFYFTNQEVFNGAPDALRATLANPKFVITQFTRNIKNTFCVIASLTELPPFLYKKYLKGFSYYFFLLFFTIPFAFVILYGALKASRNRTMFLFILSSALIIVGNSVIIAKARYMYPLVPIFLLSAFWYGRNIANFLGRKKIVSNLIIALLFLFLSPGFSAWSRIVKDGVEDINKSELKIMERRDYSPRASFRQLELLVEGCKGVLALEHQFLGAFMDIPLNRVYDIWEIPPFGEFGNSSYDGLRPERIDCLLISQALSTGTGCATNHQIRYQNYISPYAEYLKKKGAKVYNIKNFGKAIVLP